MAARTGSRFLFIQHNYVRREHTTTKSRQSRRVDMSRQLRRALMEIQDRRLAEAKEAGKSQITEELVFRGPDGGILDPVIQSGASIVYVKEQMGHSSIQATVDIYGHLIPGANVSFVDRLDVVPAQPEAKPEPNDVKPVATPAQPKLSEGTG